MSKASVAVKKRAQREMMRASVSPGELVALPRALIARWLHVLRTKVRGAASVSTT